MNEVLEWVFALIESVDPILRTALAALAIFLETTVFLGMIMPGDTVIIVASTAIVEPWEFWALALAVLFGTLAGQSFGYWLGKYFGPKILATSFAQKHIAKQWKRATNFIDRRGGIAVFVSRFLPVLHSLTPVTVGMSNMSYKRFITWAAPAATIWAFGYSGIGLVAKTTYRAMSEQIHFAGYLFVGIILLFLLLAWGGKLLLGKWNEHDMDAPGDGDTTTIDH